MDIHAEATSEKVSMGWYLDGLVSAVLGTHTHIQTADEKVLPKGTAYITHGISCRNKGFFQEAETQFLKGFEFAQFIPYHF